MLININLLIIMALPAFEINMPQEIMDVFNAVQAYPIQGLFHLEYLNQLDVVEISLVQCIQM